MICTLKEKATIPDIRNMLEQYESLINIRPRLGNRSILIQDENLRKQVEMVTLEILGGVM